MRNRQDLADTTANPEVLRLAVRMLAHRRRRPQLPLCNRHPITRH